MEKGLLPTVTKESLGTFIAEFKSKDNYLEYIFDMISHKDPMLTTFIEEYSKKTVPYSPEPKHSGTLIYHLLDISGEIPIVNECGVDYFREEIHDVNDGTDYFGPIIKRVGEENPLVALFLSNFVRKTKEKRYTSHSGLLVYHFLEIQAQIDLEHSQPKTVQGIERLSSRKEYFSSNPNTFPITWKRRNQLNLAINREDYLLAAKLRDEINSTSEPLKGRKK